MPSQDETLAQVRRANERFYRAFETLDIDEMSAVWVQTERAKCVHPGWDMLAGWNAVRQSWAAIFHNTSYMKFLITDVAVHLYGHVAWVTCVENLTDAVESTTISRMLATNVYEFDGDDWRIVHHHASPVMRATPSFDDSEAERLN